MMAEFGYKIRLEVEGVFIWKLNKLNFVENYYLLWLFVSVPYVGAVYRHPKMLRNELVVFLVILESYREVKVVWYKKGFKPWIMCIPPWVLSAHDERPLTVVWHRILIRIFPFAFMDDEALLVECLQFNRGLRLEWVFQK